jgi:hypothetical protein
MDSLITAAARALAAGDPLGEFGRAKELLRRATRPFSPKKSVARARCIVGNLYPLTRDRSVMHSLVGCRGEQCQLQIFCRERWIY